MKTVFALLFLLMTSACGTPFDEDYWDDDLREDDDQRQEAGQGSFSADLSPVSALGFGNGDAVIGLSGNQAVVRIEMQDVPQNLVQGSVTITATPCESLVVNPPTNGAVETRDYTYVDTTSLPALFEEPSDGIVEGKNLLIHAFTRGTGTSPASGLFPFACGPILRPEDDFGGTTVETNGGVVAGTVGNVTGGTTVGTAAGTTVGTIGGVTAGGITSGTVGTTVGGVTGGTTVGTIGGTNAGVTAGIATGGFATGGTGAVAGGTGGVAGAVAGGAEGGVSGGISAGVGFPGGVTSGVTGTTAGGVTGGVGTTAGGVTSGATGATVGTTFGGAEGD